MKMMKLPEIIALALVLVAYFSNVQAELKLVHVVFRHGDRAPDSNGLESYPNDPYLHNTYAPMGLGGLLNQGKLREYNLGRYLRQEYGHFLGDTYNPKEVETRSTDYDRTKMSLQLVLAGLYPPNKLQKWNDNLNWQPIPVHSVPFMNDSLMIPEFCPRYLKYRAIFENSEDFQDKLAKHKSFMRRLSQLSEKNISNSNDMYFFYHGLRAQQAIGLNLTGWSSDIMKNGELLAGINLEYELFSYNNHMKAYNGGLMLRKLFENIQRTRKSHVNEYKIRLYSGHETNVAAMLQVLGVYEPHPPEYSSAVIVEYHSENSNSRKKDFVKVKYYKGIAENDDPEKMVEEKIVPGCPEVLCPFETFRKVLNRLIAPDDAFKNCDKLSLARELQNYTPENIPEMYRVAGNIITQLKQELEKYEKLTTTLH